MGKVTVVGSYIVALVMDTERIPIEGETVLGTNYHSTHSGKGSNMAVCAARLGADATFMGKIGKDSLGQAFCSLLQDEGVSQEAVLYSDQRPTAVGFIMMEEGALNGEGYETTVDVDQLDLDFPYLLLVRLMVNGVLKDEVIVDLGWKISKGKIR